MLCRLGESSGMLRFKRQKVKRHVLFQTWISLIGLYLILKINEALKKWKKYCGTMGIPINDKFLYTLVFAEDQVVVAWMNRNQTI